MNKSKLRGYIYGIKWKGGNEIKYIGQKSTWWGEAKDDINYLGSGTLLWYYYAKFGLTRFQKLILHENIETFEELNRLEKECIFKYETHVKAGKGGWNLNLGGGKKYHLTRKRNLSGQIHRLILVRKKLLEEENKEKDFDERLAELESSIRDLMIEDTRFKQKHLDREMKKLKRKQKRWQKNIVSDHKKFLYSVRKFESSIRRDPKYAEFRRIIRKRKKGILKREKMERDSVVTRMRCVVLAENTETDPFDQLLMNELKSRQEKEKSFLEA